MFRNAIVAAALTSSLGVAYAAGPDYLSEGREASRRARAQGRSDGVNPNNRCKRVVLRDRGAKLRNGVRRAGRWDRRQELVCARRALPTQRDLEDHRLRPRLDAYFAERQTCPLVRVVQVLSIRRPDDP